jgi:hypothetical protein
MSWIFDRNTWNGIYRNFEHNLVTGIFFWGGGEFEERSEVGFWEVILSPTPTACHACSTHVPVWVETTPITRRTPTQPPASPRTTVRRGGKKRCGDTGVLGRPVPCWYFLIYSFRNERDREAEVQWRTTLLLLNLSALCRLFAIMYLKQTMLLGYTLLQLFCICNLRNM